MTIARFGGCCQQGARIESAGRVLAYRRIPRTFPVDPFGIADDVFLHGRLPFFVVREAFIERIDLDLYCGDLRGDPDAATANGHEDRDERCTRGDDLPRTPMEFGNTGLAVRANFGSPQHVTSRAAPPTRGAHGYGNTNGAGTYH